MSRALALVAMFAGVARADTPVQRPEANEVDRELPPPGRAEFGFDGGAPVGAWAAEVSLGYVDRPIVLHGAGMVTDPVRHRETVAVGGALSLGERLVVDARLPLAHQVGDRLQGLGDDQPLEHFVLGDLALGARVGIAATSDVQAFARFLVTAPTGNDHDFAGEAKWTYSTLLVGRLELDDLVVAATGGILIRGAEVQVGDRLVGDALVGGIGAAVGLPPIAGLWCVPSQLRVTGELVGELGDEVGGQRGPSPAEARLGVVGRPLPELAIAVRAGVGLDDQIGAPRFRATVELVWQAPAAPRAASRDAIDEDDDQ